jgi:DNA-binding transcriptional LysR family regulator
MGPSFHIPLELIPAFLLLAEELNISRCARKLGISQPALTRQLQTLEEAFGAQLFVRQSRGVALTQTGRSLKKEVLPLYESLQNSVAKIRDTQTKLSGTLTFGCFSEIGTHVISPVLFDFCKINPSLSLDIRYLSENEIILGVAGGQLNLGIASQPPANESVRSYKLMTERIVLVTSAENPNLVKHSKPKFTGFRSHDRLLQGFCKNYPELFPAGSPEITIAVNSHQAMINAVRLLGHYAAMPLHSVNAALREGLVRIAAPQELSNKVYLVMPDSEFPERRTVEVVKFLKSKFKSIEGTG